MEAFEGTDPVGYIISANIHRRHMTRAQRGMALAMMAPEAENGKGGRGKTAKIFAVFEGDERTAMKRGVNKARFVLKHKPLLAPEVLSGIIPLDNAFKQAEAAVKAQVEQLDPIAELRNRRPDLADQVALLARIWSLNGSRRHQSKGSLAMVAATIYPEPTKATDRGRGNKCSVTEHFEGVPRRALSEARTVLVLAPDLVEDVKNGASLADAYETALAYQLTEEARDDRRKALRSIAYQLHARGLTQRQIADKLGEKQPTISRWLKHFSEAPECLDAPALPSADTLDRIAADIKAAAKAEVKAEAADEIKAEVEAIRKDFAPSERVAILQTIEVQTQQGARTDINGDLSQNLGKSQHWSKDKAAKLAGFGNRETARQATRVVEHGTPELVAAMDNDEGRIIA